MGAVRKAKHITFMDTETTYIDHIETYRNKSRNKSVPSSICFFLERTIMGILGGITGENYPAEIGKKSSLGTYEPRTFEEQIRDRIAHYQSQINNLQSVLDSMSPDVKKFVGALQKANL